MKFGEVLKMLRKRKGMSQQELANATGLTNSAIGMYETGAREPNYDTLELLADYFNVDVSTMLGRKTIATTPMKDFAQWMCTQLTDEGKAKLDIYLRMLATDPDNIDPNKFVKDIFIDNLTPEAKATRKEIAEQLRILNKKEKSLDREAKKNQHEINNPQDGNPQDD